MRTWPAGDAMATTAGTTGAGTTEGGGSDPRQRHLSVGNVTLPIEYRDGSLLNIVAFVRQAAVRALLPTTRLHPVVVRGKATMLLTIFEYRDTSVGPYNELSVAFLVRPEGSGLGAAGAWVQDLPVTTEIALAAGKEIWGYPKWVQPISWEHRGDTIRAGLPGELSVTARARRWPAIRVPVPMSTYTVHEGRLVRTTLRLAGSLRFARGGAVDVEVTGDGRVARTLRALGVDRRAPAFAMWCDDLRATLPEGRDAGRASEPRSAAPVPASSS